jgi:tetratricopeptide (TPR) repeat protein
MVNILTGEPSTDLFGGDVPPQAKELVEKAREESDPQRALALLWTAQVCAPECPSLYYLLYKFYARHADFEQAELAALKGLDVAASQAHLPDDWRIVTRDMADFGAPGPARFWAFTLKALAFIRLRRQDPEAARAYLDKVNELDPEGGSGAGVIEALIKGSQQAR